MILIRFFLVFIFLISQYNTSLAQLINEDFESNSPTLAWVNIDCIMDVPLINPFRNGINTSANVLRYHDVGGLYANVRFDINSNFQLSETTTFSFKIYISSGSFTGNQPNQVSLKLQNKNLASPWSTQSEIIKNITPDVWQEVSFDFANGPYINLDPSSAPPITRTDFNRVVIQVNGENNTDQVLAYIDDFKFNGIEISNPVDTIDPVYDALVWSDEFDYEGAADDSKWFHQTLLPNGNSWYNGEIQHYTNRLDNTYVKDGKLHIVAKRENFSDQGVQKGFTSARLNSKFAFTYGRVEVRAKLPTGIGTWPAIWMLGKNITEQGSYWYNEGYGTTPWPACGEIDIMEHWGHNQNFVQSAMHTPSSHGNTVNHGGQVIPTASTAFHVYTLDWYKDRMVFSVDDVVHYEYKPENRNASTWPFEADQFILLNIAIQPSISSGFTQSSMEIDYVRVYQESIVSSNDNIDRIKKISITPNPVNNECNVYIPDDFADTIIDIYNVQGTLIKSIKVTENNIKIDLSAWQSGIYLFKCTRPNFQKTFRIYKL
jgi:beta-glucanase (GH16 family)